MRQTMILDSPDDLDATWRPSTRDLSQAQLISNWLVFDRCSGPYLIHGNVAGRELLAELRAMDAVAGWALIADQLLILGERSPAASIAVLPREIIARAAAPLDEYAQIRAEVVALAERAHNAGMPAVVSWLECAAFETKIGAD